MTTLIPFNEFNLKDTETQKALLTKWREVYDNASIRSELGISNKAFYDLVADLEIPKKRRVEDRDQRNKLNQNRRKLALRLNLKRV